MNPLQKNNSEQLSTEQIVTELIVKARQAMVDFQNDDQQRVDEAVCALAWSIYQPDNARMLAELAVKDTGLGNVPSKVIKNTRKTFGTLRDLLRVRTVGVIAKQPERGLTLYGKPVGVVAALCPSTNPAATPVNKAMMSIKGGNAVIIAPSPAGYNTTQRTVQLMRQELVRSGHPANLVQILPAPVSKQTSEQLVRQADLAVVTGSQNNVQRAMQSGTVAIGVGAGNVPVIIDSTADLTDAAKKIAASKTFDNATSCSSENALLILDDIYEDAIEALRQAGGYLCNDEEKQSIIKTLWIDAKLNRSIIAKGAKESAMAMGLSAAAHSASFFMVEENSVGGKHSLADEKLSLVLTIYRASSIGQAIELVGSILDVTGKGHSAGIHTSQPEHSRMLAERTDVVRVMVNQAHTFGNGGSFDNAMPFTLSMGGGTWAGNTISENLNYHHFINITHLVTTIPEDKPSEEELFGDYWRKYGKQD